MGLEIKMPALSPTMEEGTLAKWLVKEGDTVKSGDIMAEIETDKATMEFEAVDEGVIEKILIAEGTDGVRSARSSPCWLVKAKRRQRLRLQQPRRPLRRQRLRSLPRTWERRHPSRRSPRRRPIRRCLLARP